MLSVLMVLHHDEKPHMKEGMAALVEQLSRLRCPKYLSVANTKWCSGAVGARASHFRSLPSLKRPNLSSTHMSSNVVAALLLDIAELRASKVCAWKAMILDSMMWSGCVIHRQM